MAEYAGIPLGVLIALITGLALILLLRVAIVERPNLKDTIALVSQLLAIPTFWFGGPWIATAVVAAIKADTLWPLYLVTLAIIFFLIVIYPLVLLIVRVSNQIGRL